MEINIKKLKGKCGIYGIRNILNSKIYVGKSTDFYRRACYHKNALNIKSKHENDHFKNAWHKYGQENFEFIILEEIDRNLSNLDEVLKERELFWMDFYKSTERPFGYNLRRDSATKMIVHEETKAKLRITQKGERNGNFGHNWSEAKKAEASKYLKEQFKNGRVVNKEACEKGLKAKSKLWEEKPELKELMAKRVSEKNRNYIVCQFDENLVLIKEWTQPELRKSEFYLPGILQLCNGNKKGFYKQCIWRYKVISTGEVLWLEIPKKEDFSILKIDKITNQTIKEYKSAKEVNIEHPHGVGNITNMCKHKLIWKSTLYYFRYKQEYYGVL